MDYTNLSLDKVEKIYAEYKTLEQQERMLFLKKVMAEDCEKFTILPKKAVKNHYWYNSSVSDID